LYDFPWGDLCDWYLEMAKPALKGDEGIARKRATQSTLVSVFRSILQLLHPFVPFITEELWASFSFSEGFMENHDWPEADDNLIDSSIESSMSSLQDVIRNIRNLRAEAHLPPQQAVPTLIVRSDEEMFKELLMSNSDMISMLTRVDTLEIRSMDSGKPEKSLSTVLGSGELFLEVGDLIDIDTEIQRLEQELKSLEKNISTNKKKLANPHFVSKAPAEVVEQERERLKAGEERKLRIVENINSLRNS
jgi:valyl-tRNA synthetase